MLISFVTAEMAEILTRWLILSRKVLRRHKSNLGKRISKILASFSLCPKEAPLRPALHDSPYLLVRLLQDSTSIKCTNAVTVLWRTSALLRFGVGINRHQGNCPTWNPPKPGEQTQLHNLICFTTGLYCPTNSCCFTWKWSLETGLAKKQPAVHRKLCESKWLLVPTMHIAHDARNVHKALTANNTILTHVWPITMTAKQLAVKDISCGWHCLEPLQSDKFQGMINNLVRPEK
jgi:hypothetical protein